MAVGQDNLICDFGGRQTEGTEVLVMREQVLGLGWAVCWHVTDSKTALPCVHAGTASDTDVVTSAAWPGSGVSRLRSRHQGSRAHHKDTLMVCVSLEKY